MGKISDALERHNKEKVIIIEGAYSKAPKLLIPEEPETARARSICTRNNCSEELVVISDPDSADAEIFRLLRGQILFPQDRERPRSLLVTSTFPGEGKTFVAANLAASLALSVDEYVLLVDCDLRRPRLPQMLGYVNTYGLHEYLLGKRGLEDIIIQSAIEKLSILPAGALAENPTELLSSAAMRAFWKEINQRYQDRLVIVDSAPTHITAEAKAMSDYFDGIIFVIMARKSPSKEIRRAIHNLGKEKIFGIVFNGYGQARRSYHKYYKKYYKRK